MLRTIFSCVIMTWVLVSIGSAYGQPGQFTVVVPTTPGSAPGVEGVRPESSPGRRGGKPKVVPVLPADYKAKDKDGDGQIGLYEWERSKYAEFFKLDKNGDGFLTAQELVAKAPGSTAKLRIGGPDKEALPNPGNLSAYNQKIGETFSMSVTGQTGGAIWGTGSYTTDSDLATVAVHAGILKEGETGVIRVTITEPPAEFTGSMANGVTSGDWKEFPAAFTVR